MYMGKIGQKSAAFINHKPFHPGSYRNLEKVWIAEQAHAANLKKEQELLDKRQQESKVEELRRALHEGAYSSGGKLAVAKEQVEGVSRLEWMYRNSGQLEQDEQEAYLLGTKELPTARNDEVDRIKQLEAGGDAAGALLLTEKKDKIEGDLPELNKEDLLRKMREDPMFAIKRAEMEYKKQQAPLSQAKRLKRQLEAAKRGQQASSSSSSSSRTPSCSSCASRSVSSSARREGFNRNLKRRLSNSGDSSMSQRPRHQLEAPRRDPKLSRYDHHRIISDASKRRHHQHDVSPPPTRDLSPPPNRDTSPYGRHRAASPSRRLHRESPPPPLHRHRRASSPSRHREPYIEPFGREMSPPRRGSRIANESRYHQSIDRRKDHNDPVDSFSKRRRRYSPYSHSEESTDPRPSGRHGHDNGRSRERDSSVRYNPRRAIEESDVDHRRRHVGSPSSSRRSSHSRRNGHREDISDRGRDSRRPSYESRHASKGRSSSRGHHRHSHSHAKSAEEKTLEAKRRLEMEQYLSIDELERQRRREIEREFRLERAGKKGKRFRANEERDIAEQIALGEYHAAPARGSLFGEMPSVF